jgi:microcystin-dependent protein
MEGTMAEIRMFAGNFEPKTWAYCAGQLLAINTNQALFALLGTIYGGNGQTTFALPDFRGRAPMGTGTATDNINTVQLGEISGTTTVTATTLNMPAHNHGANQGSTISISALGDGGSTGSPNGNTLASLAGLYSSATPDSTLKAVTVAVNVGVSGGSQPISIGQPYLGMNYIICLMGIFPSRN